MSEYRYELTVDVHDLDFNGVARGASLLRYMQSAAQSQLTENGMSYDNLKSRNRAFIISRIRMEFTEPVRAYHKLTAISYPCESRGFSFLRCYRIEREGRTIGRAASVWALLDTEKHALVRVDQFDLRLPACAPPADLAVGHIRLPAEMRRVGNYKVRYCEVDQNRHMNNTAYLDLFAEYLPLDGKRIAAATVSYLNEAPAGDLLTVECGCAPNDLGEPIYFFRTTRSDGKINAEAEIELCPIN